MGLVLLQGSIIPIDRPVFAFVRVQRSRLLQFRDRFPRQFGEAALFNQCHAPPPAASLDPFCAAYFFHDPFLFILHHHCWGLGVIGFLRR